MKRTIRSIPLKYQIFISFSVILLSIVLVFWSFSIHYLDNQINKSRQELVQAKLNEMALTINSAMEQAWLFADSAMLTSFARNLGSGFYEYSAFDLASYHDQFFTSVSQHPYIDGMFLLFPRENLVVSNFTVLESMDIFYRYEIQFAAGRTDVQTLFANTPYRRILLEEVSYAQLQEPCLVLLQKDVSMKPDQAICAGMLLPVEELLKMHVSRNTHGLSACLYGEGVEAWLGDPVPQAAAPAFREIMDSNETGLFLSDNHMVVSSISLGNGLFLCLGQQQDGLLTSIELVRTMLNVVLVLALLFGIAAAFVLSRHFGNGISRLLALFGTNHREHVDELTAIHREVTDLLDREVEIRGQLTQVLPRFRQYLLQSLLENRLDLEQAQHALSMAELPESLNGALWIGLQEASLPFADAYAFKRGAFHVTVLPSAAADEPADQLCLPLSSWIEMHSECLYGFAALVSSGQASAGQLPAAAEFGLEESLLHQWQSAARTRSIRQMSQAIETLCLSTDDLWLLRAQAAYLLVLSGCPVPSGFPEADQAELLGLCTGALETFTDEQRVQQENETRNAHRQKILSAIEQHYLEPDFSLDRLADELLLSKSYLSSLINSIFNTGYIDLVSAMRVDYSLTLLASGFTVEQAAAQSGFQSTATYRRAFKKHLGMSPVEYVQQSCKCQF